jgi:hypothetical protein
MEKLRGLPYQDVNVTFTIPTTYVSNEAFVATITDLKDLSFTTKTVTNNANYVWTIGLSSKYDTDYHVVITDASNDIIYDETYEIVRPYVKPSELGETASEIAEYTKYEEIARAVIDSVIPEGFYYKKRTLEVVGLGADYIPLWWDAKRILAVYENDVLVEDRAYEITRDKTAITETVLGGVNRNEQAPLILPAAGSDLVDTVLPPLRGFPNGYDYKFVLEVGYPTVPSDIVRAATLLIDDIKCGRNDYYQRYISAYNTDQFRLQFDSRVFEGTGNIIVDKILSKYAKSITRLGVL